MATATTPNPTILGNDLTDIVWGQGSPIIRKQEYGDPANPQTAFEVERYGTILRSLALGFCPPFETADTEIPGARLKAAVIGGGDSIETEIRLVYRTPDYQSRPIDFRPTDVVLEMDISLRAVPVELAWYYNTTDGSGAKLTALEFANVQTLIAVGATSINESGRTATGKDEDGRTITLTSKGFDLYLDKLKGQETFDIGVPIFRETKVTSLSSFTWGFNNINKLDHPGHGLPGSYVNWKVSNYRRTERRTGSGIYIDVSKEWEYSADGWNERYYKS